MDGAIAMSMKGAQGKLIGYREKSRGQEVVMGIDLGRVGERVECEYYQDILHAYMKVLKIIK